MMMACTFGLLVTLSWIISFAGPVRANGALADTPSCLAGVCVGKNAPTEKTIKHRFGGKSFNLRFRTRGYCYAVATPDKKIAHLLFSLKDFGDGWRVVSIQASERTICSAATSLKQVLALKTSEGVLLGASVASVRTTYGAAAHTLKATSQVVAEVMRSETQGLTSALQYVSADPNLNLSALFVVENDRVVAIEVSSDV